MAVFSNMTDLSFYLNRCLQQNFKSLQTASFSVSVKEGKSIYSKPTESSVSSSYEFTMQEVAYKVDFLMKHSAIKGALVLCGGKFSTHSAEVTLSPPDESIKSVVIDIFKNWIEPGVTPCRRFDHLKINGEDVKYDS